MEILNDKHDELEVESTKNSLSEDMISECERLSLTDGKTRFIFDRSTSDAINKKLSTSKEESRDISIDSVLNKEDYYISDFSEFEQMPSRFSFYDTETKLTCNWSRHKLFIEFITELGFTNGLSNLGPEFEQSFILEINQTEDFYKYIIRIKPNLMFEIYSQRLTPNATLSNKHTGFFNRKDILSFLSKTTPDIYKQIIRDIKVKSVLD